MTDRLLDLLRAMLGPTAGFRPGQREAIEAVLQPGARVLVVQRTGWGKSLVYWICSRIRRDEGAGPTLIVSPLLSLMRNQIAMAERIGLGAATINSSNREDWDGVIARLRDGEVDVLLVSPERLANQRFNEEVLPALGSIGLLVVDEAHCISDWGHDFRPDYRRLARVLRGLPPAVPVLATTATANDRVVADVAEQLGRDVAVLRGPLARDSLSLHAIRLADQAERLAWLASALPRMPGSGIVYCLTVADTRRVAAFLRSRGIDARPYHGDLDAAERLAAEEALLRNDLKALVATTALGMGFDKPDLSFVVHYQRPGSVIAYYQQVGRAGRAVDQAVAVLLAGREDDEISEYFIESAFPPLADQQAVVGALAGSAGSTMGAIEARVNLSRGQIAKVLKLLEVEGAVGRDGGRYFLTANRFEPDLARAGRVTAQRREELGLMREYVDHDGCLMEFVVRALDDPAAAPCGRCANDGGRPVEASVDPAMLAEALQFLRRTALEIPPRLLWPSGADADLRGRIQPCNMRGMALSVYGDAGWGRRVREGKYTHGRFDDELVAAAAELVVERWAPDPAPAWVTAIPSTKRPTLVRDFAVALAERLGLPFRDTLEAVPGKPQKEMENSVQQVRNVRSKMRLSVPVPGEPVLLVDDIVDSGWTLTYGGWLLGSAGVAAVHPFALAGGTRGGE